MKKFFALAAMAVMFFTASAQKAWMGGSMAINTESSDLVDETAKQFTFSPEIGFVINDRWDFAVALSYSHYSDEVTSNSFSVYPFFRYTCARVGNFQFITDMGVGYGMQHINGIDDNLNTFKVGINPGIKYCINERMGLVAHMGELSYTHGWQDEDDTDTFHASLTDNMSIGFYVTF